MIDYDALQASADKLFENVAGWETSALKRIGKRIAQCGKMSLEDIKSLNNAAIVKSDMKIIQKELADVMSLNIKEVQRIYAESLTEQHLENKPLYDYRYKAFVPFAENPELQAIAKAYTKSTAGEMLNLCNTSALAISDANGMTKAMSRFYTDALDKAALQVANGVTDFHSAMRDTVAAMGGSGIRVDYGGGLTRRLDTAVRQSLLWGAKQENSAYYEIIGEELECDGIEVDWHANPRPAHEFMQGKQYAFGRAKIINGKLYESADEALERMNDYGCYHCSTPIICGVSEPRYSQSELKRLNAQNAKRYIIDSDEFSGYEVTQMYRKLETQIRRERTTQEVAKSAGDKVLETRCAEKVRRYKAKYAEIENATKIQGDRRRMITT